MSREQFEIYYYTETNKQLAVRLNVSRQTVRNIAMKLGLYKGKGYWNWNGVILS